MTTTRRSPPRHRHDGTSPLPLGMDASPAPARWNGASTVWPHDPRTGWSYCVLIPSWVVLPEARTADGVGINPTVYFRVQAGIQSPQGVSVLHGTLRRFSDFLKLQAALKRVFPKKRIPSAPPRSALLRINASHSLLQERRRALEEWMGRLLADIDISRSATIASFLELEAAARKAASTVSEGHEATTPVVDDISAISQSVPNSRSSFLWTGSAASGSLSTTYSTSGVQTPIKSGDSSEIEMESIVNSETLDGIRLAVDSKRGDYITQEEHASSEVDIQEASDAGSASLGQAKWTPGTDAGYQASVKGPVLVNASDSVGSHHQRKASFNSIASEFSSARDSEQSLLASVPTPAETGSLREFGDGKAEPLGTSDIDFLKGVGIVLPKDNRSKVNRVFMSLQRRVAVAETDIEELVTRLSQETAVKDFLATKVKDLEGDLDNARRKSKEVLRHALSTERERVTSLQWELEDTRAALLNLEDSINQEQSARKEAEDGLQAATSAQQKAEEEVLKLQEKCTSLQEALSTLEAQAKSDRKIMAKEIKTLRKVHPELKDEVQQALQAKLEIEAKLLEQKQKQERETILRSQFLHEVSLLQQRLQECSVEFLAKEEGQGANHGLSPDAYALDLLETSDNRIGFLVAEAQLLAEEGRSETGKSPFTNGSSRNGPLHNGGQASQEDTGIDQSVRKILTDVFIENAQLRKSLNSLHRNDLLRVERKGSDSNLEEPVNRKSVLGSFLKG